MTRAEIVTELERIMRERLELALPAALTESDRLYEDLNVDSIMVLQLLVYVEEVMGVTVPDDEVDPAVFTTMGTFVTYVEGLRSAG